MKVAENKIFLFWVNLGSSGGPITPVFLGAGQARSMFIVRVDPFRMAVLGSAGGCPMGFEFAGYGSQMGF